MIYSEVNEDGETSLMYKLKRMERKMFPSGIRKSWIAIMRLVGPIVNNKAYC